MVSNLSEAEAREFFFEHVLPALAPQLACGEAEWRQVYEVRGHREQSSRCSLTGAELQVCGGNPGALRACAVDAVCLESWTHGARPRIGPLLRGLRRAATDAASLPQHVMPF